MSRFRNRLLRLERIAKQQPVVSPQVQVAAYELMHISEEDDRILHQIDAHTGLSQEEQRALERFSVEYERAMKQVTAGAGISNAEKFAPR